MKKSRATLAIGITSILVSVSMAQNEQKASRVILRQGPAVKELVDISLQRKPVDVGLGADWLIARWQVENGLSPQQANQLFQATTASKLKIDIPQWWQEEALLLLSGKLAEFDKHLPAVRSLTARRPFVKVGSKMARPPVSFFSNSKKIYGGTDGKHTTLVGTDAHIATDLLILQANTSELVASIPSSDWCPLISPGELAATLNRPIESALELDISNSVVTVFGKSENHLFISQYDFQIKRLLIYFEDINNTGNFFRYSEERLKNLDSFRG